MCGINGAFAYSESALCPSADVVLRVRDAMANRGPDGAGIYVSAERRCILGHRRLAIIDLSANSAQPMQSDDGSMIVTFNGEIYNYRELREELESSCDARFRTSGDTEVLLQLYRRFGTSMLSRLRGMFAFAIWDASERVLFIARDPHGIKPLYYSDASGTLTFASSIRALLCDPAMRREANPAAVVSFLAWGSIDEPLTLVSGIRQLEAGSWLRVKAGQAPELHRYWTVADHYRTPHRTGADVRAEVTASLRNHLVADVPVACFLSAGIDSSVLAALASQATTTPLRTVTLGFEEFRNLAADEVPLASEVARHYGTEHINVIMSRREVLVERTRFMATMDSPTVDGLNVYLVSKAARDAGCKVALSGLGADELFGGYGTFSRYPILRRLGRLLALGHKSTVLGTILRPLGSTQRKKLVAFAEHADSPAWAYLALRGLFMPSEIEQLIGSDLWRAAGRSAFIDDLDSALATLGSAWTQIAVAEQIRYMRNQLLRDADWTSMAHGLEVRVPYVDHLLTERIAPEMARTEPRRKRALAAVATANLPPAVLRRSKTGFGLPLQTWLASEFSETAARPAWPRFLRGPGSEDAVQRVYDSVATGGGHWSRAWALRVLSEHCAQLGLS